MRGVNEGGKLGTLEDLHRIWRFYGGVLHVVQAGPRGIIAYSCGGRYLGFFDTRQQLTETDRV